MASLFALLGGTTGTGGGATTRTTVFLARTPAARWNN